MTSHFGFHSCCVNRGLPKELHGDLRYSLKMHTLYIYRVRKWNTNERSSICIHTPLQLRYSIFQKIITHCLNISQNQYSVYSTRFFNSSWVYIQCIIHFRIRIICMKYQFRLHKWILLALILTRRFTFYTPNSYKEYNQHTVIYLTIIGTNEYL